MNAYSDATRSLASGVRTRVIVSGFACAKFSKRVRDSRESVFSSVWTLRPVFGRRDASHANDAKRFDESSSGSDNVGPIADGIEFGRMRGTRAAEDAG
jgi:hypothetical protein